MSATPPRRLLHCIPQLHAGGSERQVMLIAPAMVRLGFETHVAARMRDRERAKLAAAGVVCHDLPRRRRFDPRLALDLAALLRRVRPDAALMWLTPMIVPGGAIATLLRVPWVTVERGSPPAYRNRAKEALRQLVGRRARAVVANSPQGMSLWAGCPRAHIILNAVDRDSIAGGRPVHKVPGRRLLLSLSRLLPEKQVDVALRAFAASGAADLDLAIVGDGPDRPRLEALAESLGVAGRVRFAGHRDDVPDWLASADLVVSASGHEGQPNSVLEAAEAGLPLILSDIPAHRAIVGDAVMADEAAMSRAIAAGLGAHQSAGSVSAEEAALQFASAALGASPGEAGSFAPA